MRDDAKAKLATSAIAPAEATDAAVFSVDDASRIHPSFAPVPSIGFDYLDYDGSRIRWGDKDDPFIRVRYLRPVFPKRKQWGPQKVIRYAQPYGSPVEVYIPWTGDPHGPAPWLDVIDDPSFAICITEGELKALCSSLCGLPTLGLGGVFNFLGMDGKLLPRLRRVEWRGRVVYIAFDSDAAHNPQVAVAEARLVELLTQLGARPCIVRIPEGPNGEKQGIDDFVEANGSAAWLALVQSTPPLTGIDKGVLAMNAHVAWIEREAKAIDLKTHNLISPATLMAGSRFSAMKVAVTDAEGKLKQLQTAKLWLTHAYTQRYDDILFRPNGGDVVHEHGKTALNLWTGLTSAPGDCAPFLELSEFLFSRLRGEAAELPLKLLAYKAQHPEEKIPLAIILIGLQGCGKSLWSEIVRDAFSPYGVELASSALEDEHQGWLEKTLICVINEAKSRDMFMGAERLRSLISDETQNMNEKYRIPRQVKNYTFFIITSNSRAAGSFAGDDRRNIVVDCPPKREKAFYSRIREWYRRQGGPARLMDYLLSLDLGAWTPPVEAPMTAEKHMAYHEGLTPVQTVAAKALEAKTSPVLEWLDSSMTWATQTETAGDHRATKVAEEIKRSINHFQVRPFYSPEELSILFPAITRDLYGNRKVYSTVAGHISRQLRDAGLSYLENRDDPRGFRWKGEITQFIVIAEFDDWRQPIGQADFERLMKNWPTYGELRSKITILEHRRMRDGRAEDRR